MGHELQMKHSLRTQWFLMEGLRTPCNAVGFYVELQTRHLTADRRGYMSSILAGLVYLCELELVGATKPTEVKCNLSVNN